jgi:cholesterol transport system auxiliary component
MGMGLTNRLIGHLQKTFHQPQVYAYPWDTQRQPVLKLKVQVTRFIAQEGTVYLDANWEIENLQTKKQHAELFSTKVSTADDATSIIESMNVAFSKLEAQIAQRMTGF